MRKKRVGVVVVLILIAALIVGAFVLVIHRSPKTEEETTEVAELDELLNKDITVNYPATPREVMKLYNRYMLCLYGSDNGKMTDGQMQQLGIKMRDLYDDELMESNPQDTYLLNLAQEINSFKQEGKVIMQANVCDSNDVEYIDVDGESGALVEVSYFIKNSSKEFTRTYQQYLLRKDADGNWKILGFEKVDRSDGGES